MERESSEVSKEALAINSFTAVNLSAMPPSLNNTLNALEFTDESAVGDQIEDIQVEDVIASWADLLKDTTKKNSLVSFKTSSQSVLQLFPEPSEKIIIEKSSIGKNQLNLFMQENTEFLSTDCEALPAKDAQQAITERSLASSIPVTDFVFPKQLAELFSGNTVSLSAFYTKFISSKRKDIFSKASFVHKKALSSLEEKGLDTCHVFYGLMHLSSFKEGTLAFPIFILPANIELNIATSNAKITASGSLKLNPFLVAKLDLKNAFNQPLSLEDLGIIDGTFSKADFVTKLKTAFLMLNDLVPSSFISEVSFLANFTYDKLAMVSDLKNNMSLFSKHPILQALAGVKHQQQKLGDFTTDSFYDNAEGNTAEPLQEFLILDADSSQSRVISSALKGQSLVLKGPPGTGKSQTIANLIASFSSQGKSILFVAEKQAAIEAVTKKLKEKNLDSLVMDLHGKNSTKTVFYDEIRTSLASALEYNTSSTAQQKFLDYDTTTYTEACHVLENYQSTYLDTTNEFGVSFYETLEFLNFYKKPTLNSRLSKECLLKIKKQGFTTVESLVKEYSFNSFKDISLLPVLWQTADFTKVDSSDKVRALQKEAYSLRWELLPALLTNLASCTALFNEILLEVPSNVSKLSYLFSLQDKWLSLSKLCPMDIWKVEETSVRKNINSSKKKKSSFTKSFFKSINETIALEEKLLAEKHAFLTECVSLKKEAAFIFKKSPSHLENNLAFSALKNTFISFLKALNHFADSFDASFLASFSNLNLNELLSFMDELLLDNSAVFSYLAYLASESKLEELLLTEFLHGLQKEKLPASDVPHVFKWSWYKSINDQLSFKYTLARVDLEQQREVFKKEDLTLLSLAPMCLLHKRNSYFKTLTAVTLPEFQLLKAELSKKRSQKAIVKTFSDSKTILLNLKPCWALSPLLVSQLLPAETIFDVVIFDEASQVLPQDAVAAISRAKQVIVSGDSMQLPPTTFFTEATADISEAATAGVESILDAFSSFLPIRSLKWHYRSKDESLIAFSNKNFYNDSLITFPPPYKSKALHSFIVKDSSSYTGYSSSEEVLKVVELIITHASKYPDKSLGVITMGQKHADSIENYLIQRRKELPASVNAFFEKPFEKFFVKNLERVQGDERDSIILSIGYAKLNGKLRHFFGPLNMLGGERRLNVAITRARSSMSVVSSFEYGDIDVTKSNAKGVLLLREFLKYVQEGHLEDTTILLKNDYTMLDSPFEESVLKALNSKNINAFCQVGSSGYKIDFALIHPDKPSRMVLALECDGASYHRFATVRDRDRLRQDQLESLGWKFYRLWSTNWFENPGKELEKIVTAFYKAVEKADLLDAENFTIQENTLEFMQLANSKE